MLHDEKTDLPAYEHLPIPKTIVRFSTAGSVDDGKSTFIGRLLYDTGNLYQDHIQALEAKSKAQGESKLALALVTDGLKAEREQGITIDVAYRYFTTAKRRFILADAPGHEQYTRNMATAASRVDLTVILVDARNGIVQQTKRHAFIASLLGVPRLLVAMNKMDLVDYSQARFDQLVEEFTEFASKLGIKDIRFIPVVSLDGDNIAHRSEKLSWYGGETVLDYLETVFVSGDHNLVDFRYPVQSVIRGEKDFRGYAGTVESGSIRVGEELIVFPGNKRSNVKSIVRAEKGTEVTDLPEARAGDAVVITLAHNIDASRGALFARPNNVPRAVAKLEAMLVWMDEEPLGQGRKLLLRQTTRTERCEVSKISYKVDINTLHRFEAADLGSNDIARVSISLTHPIFVDPYARNRNTGSFILIDSVTHRTIAAGMVLDRAPSDDSLLEEAIQEARNLHGSDSLVSHEERVARTKTVPYTVWLTGLSGSGKSTIAQALERMLFDEGLLVARLDGDVMRHGLCNDLGFSEADRSENVRRTAEAARLLNSNGLFVICSLISPYAADRQRARDIVGKNFREVYVKASLETCRARDPHGLYGKAGRGEIKNFTGIDAPYEEPVNPELIVDTERTSLEEVCREIKERFLA